MSKERTARAVIEIQKQEEMCIISIKRTKYKMGIVDRIYDTLPGGHIENAESCEEALYREIQEELGIQIYIDTECMKMYNETLHREETFFHCRYKSGKIGMGTGPEWLDPNPELYGDYEIIYIPVSKLSEYPLVPEEVKEYLMKYYQNKFSK